MKKSLCIVLSVTVLLAMSACGNKENMSKNDSEGLVTSIHADYPVYDSAKEIVDSAGLVFSGTVKSISYEVLDVSSCINRRTGKTDGGIEETDSCGRDAGCGG